jgi:uncharacterized membrane protein YqaE (UPF0057 family)
MNLILFLLGVVGMTHIIVDSEIGEPLHEWITPRIPRLAKLMDCYQCAGFWCGIALGLALLSYRPCIVFAAGCAGSFLAQVGWLVLDALERYAKDK